jgi:hypothetical protein
MTKKRGFGSTEQLNRRPYKAGRVMVFGERKSEDAVEL